jgi:hypothetical protein
LLGGGGNEEGDSGQMAYQGDEQHSESWEAVGMLLSAYGVCSCGVEDTEASNDATRSCFAMILSACEDVLACAILRRRGALLLW